MNHTIDTAAARPEGSFQSLVESLNAVIWEMDAGTQRFTYVSQRAGEMLGYPLHRWYDEPGFWAEQVVHPADRERVAPIRTPAGGATRDHDLEYRAVAADGRTLWLRDVVRAVRGDGGNSLLRGITFDITRQKEANPTLRSRDEQLLYERRARRQAEEEQGRSAFLARAGSLLASSLDYETTLNTLAHLAVPEIADWCAVDVLDEDGRVRRLAVAHPDPVRERLARELEERYPPNPAAPHGVPLVLRTGQPELVPEIPEEIIQAAAVDEDHLHILRELDLRSYMVVPLSARGRILGAISFVSAESGRRYGTEDLAFASALAQRAALAVDNACLFREVESARRQTQQILESITDAFLALDRQWRFTYVNDEAERLLHRPREELLGRGFWEEFPEAVGSTFHQQYHRAVEERRTVQFEEFYPPLNSWFEVRAYPSEEGLAVYFRNINDRKRTEAELRERTHHAVLGAEVGAAVAEGDDLQAVLRHAGEAVTRHLDAIQVQIWLLDAAGEALELHGSAGVGSPDPRDRVAVGEGVVGAVAAERAPLWSNEVRREPRFSVEDSARHEAVVSFAAMPMVVEERLLGVIAMSGRSPVSDAALVALRGVADRVALAVEHIRAEQELQWSERRFRSLVEATAAIVWSTPASGQFEPPQAEWAAFTGQSPDEYRGTGWLDAVHPEDRACTAAAWRKAFASHHPYQAEHRLRRHDGEYRHMAARGVPVFRADSGIREWVGIHTDITEQRRLEQALQESEQQFRTMSNSIPQLAWMADASGYISWYNQRWYDYTGTTPEEMEGWGWRSVHHPDEVDGVVERFTAALQAGEPWEDTFPLRSGTGEYRWFLSRALPLRDEQGRVVRWFGTNTDITEQREAEALRERLIAALNNERSRLQSVFLQAPAAISVSRGPEHRVELANPRYRALIGGRDVVGLTAREAFPEVDGQGFFELLDQVYASGEPYEGREMHVRLDRDGDGAPEDGYFNFVYQPLFDADGNVYGIMTHTVEVTAQVRARQEVEEKAEELARLARALEQTNHELDQFAYVASHDLKAPLRGIANLSRWIEEDLEEEVNPEVRQHLDLLRGRVHRMEGLIDGILQYSRAGRMREKPEQVDVGELLREVVDLLAPPEHVSVDIPSDMPTVLAERLPLQQVFLNLIGNAVKYRPPTDARVEVRARDLGTAYEFAVADNGPGIAPEYHDRIFGIFQTLEARDKVEGTGIGLSLVKKLVESRGGRVTVESEEGAGATFRFTWPKHL